MLFLKSMHLLLFADYEPFYTDNFSLEFFV